MWNSQYRHNYIFYYETTENISLIMKWLIIVEVTYVCIYYIIYVVFE